MPTITLHTSINAPIEKVFDISRDVQAHVNSTANTNEIAIAGKTEGLLELHDWVTWQAKHLGITQQLTAKITTMKKPEYFVDEMVQGAFKSFKHKHLFKTENGVTVMTDIFIYKSPLGVLGKLADVLFLKRYMTRFLKGRNQYIKNTAEATIFS